MKDDNFIRRFRESCQRAQECARGSKQQFFVVSFMEDEERKLFVISLNNLPVWIDENIKKGACVHYLTSPQSLF